MRRLAMVFAIGLALIGTAEASSAAQAYIDGTWIVSTIDGLPPQGISETLVIAGGSSFTYAMTITVNGTPTTITGNGTIENTGGSEYLFTIIGQGGEKLPMPMTLSSDGNSLTGSAGTPIKTFVYMRKQ